MSINSSSQLSHDNRVRPSISQGVETEEEDLEDV